MVLVSKLALTQPVYGQSDVRHKGGMTSIQAFAWNVGSCHRDDKGKIQATEFARMKVPMRETVTDERVVTTNFGNAKGAKALKYSAFLNCQPTLGMSI